VSFNRIGVRPDGRGLLAYGTIPRGELQRFDQRKRRFERLLGGESVGMVRASPDGQWLAWVSFPESTLWRGRRDGSNRLQLTSPPERAWLPSWSPDGRRIAFVGHQPGDAGRSVRLVSVDGGAVEILARPGADSFWDPCWLPDGRSLVFGELSFLPGRGIHRLDLTTRAITPFDGARGLLYPKCGPQGQMLATRPAGVGDRSRPSALMLYTPERGAWEEIGPFGLVYPTWTRDGRAFCSLDREANRVACYSFSTRRVETLAEIGDNPLLSWVNVPWFGLDADDSPLLMFDRSTRDVYALDWEMP
jgi:Tol biopolymer transport system component